MSTEVCEAYYQGLHEQCNAILRASFKEGFGQIQTKSHNLISECDIWFEILNNRPEHPVFIMAVREYQFSLQAIVLGHYRQAFSSLRLFFELFIAAIYFSAHEVELRLWLRGERDLFWKSLIDIDKGVVAVQFIRAFSEDLFPEAASYRTLAEKVYRECSEYVHGNAHTHSMLPDSLEFSEEAFRTWHEKAGNMHEVAKFLLASRYLDSLDADSIQKVEGVLLDSLGHLEAIRSKFGATTET